MSEHNYDQFKAIVNMCQMPCAVFSVEKKADGSCGEIIMVATNDSFSMTGEPMEGKPYTERLPKDSKFEDIVFNAAFNGEHYCSYIDTTRIYGFWTENIIIPLTHDDDSNTGYCQFVYNLTRDMDAGKYSIIAPDIATFVIRTCVDLRNRRISTPEWML